MHPYEQRVTSSITCAVQAGSSSFNALNSISLGWRASYEIGPVQSTLLRSWAPIATSRRSRQMLKWSFSCKSINDLYDSRVNFTPRTTAHTMMGRMEVQSDETCRISELSLVCWAWLRTKKHYDDTIITHGISNGHWIVSVNIRSSSRSQSKQTNRQAHSVVNYVRYLHSDRVTIDGGSVINGWIDIAEKHAKPSRQTFYTDQIVSVRGNVNLVENVVAEIPFAVERAFANGNRRFRSLSRCAWAQSN
jgi:hypothetical protein